MASVNPLSRELVFKIVYYGPGLGGKTTTLEHLHATAKPEHRGKLVSLATPVDRTLYFDFLPVRLPPVRGMNVRLQLFTVPGQVYFNATRKLVLTGADGIVFVSDSQIVRADSNLESLENLRENLADQGRDLASMPLVFQHNKRDLPDLLPIEELNAMLNPFGAPAIGTSAKTGMGVYEGLEKISGSVMTSFETRLPESIAAELAQFQPEEGGLVRALRGATDSDAPPPSDVVVAKISAPGAYPSFPPEASTSIAPAAPSASEVNGASEPATPSNGEIDDGEHVSEHELIEEPLSLRESEEAPLAAAPEDLARDSEPLMHPSATAPPRRAGLSFAELWPDGEQTVVREIEEAIAQGTYWRAIELCETLVSRVLASAAGLFGSSDAPRDPATVPLLLGLDGRRYLGFRAVVREARAGGLITARDALSAYAFAIDARLARSSIH